MSSNLIEQLERVHISHWQDPVFYRSLACRAAARIRELEAEVARLSDGAQGVGVKPLEWDGDFAHTGFGMFYRIDRQETRTILYRIEVSGRIGILANEPDDVMHAAAQADYERRIRSTLTPAPDTEGET